MLAAGLNLADASEAHLLVAVCFHLRSCVFVKAACGKPAHAVWAADGGQRASNVSSDPTTILLVLTSGKPSSAHNRGMEALTETTKSQFIGDESVLNIYPRGQVHGPPEAA
jgi:hypothetical protein